MATQTVIYTTTTIGDSPHNLTSSFLPLPPFISTFLSSLPLSITTPLSSLLSSIPPSISTPLSNIPPSILLPLAFLLPLLLLTATHHSLRTTHLRSHLSHRLTTATATQFIPLWNTKSWVVLSLLCDQWLRGLIPGDGMWTPRNAAALRAKEDTSALRKLVRMGIYPLYVQDGGGPFTAREKGGGVSAWGRVTLPVWRQSKRRAVFEFVVPRGRGWNEEDVAGLGREEQTRRREDAKYLLLMRTLVRSMALRRAGRWRTAATGIVHVRARDLMDDRWETSKMGPDPEVPVEVGATSCFKGFLPFKLDRILRGGWVKSMMGSVRNWLQYGFLLSAVQLPIVRIEAPDDDDIELDKEVLLIAQNFRLDKEGWDEEVAQGYLADAYRENGIEPPE